MDYVTVRELREKSGEIWRRVEAGEEFVVTRHGKPFALLVHTESSTVEERLRALRLHRFGETVDAIRRQARQSGADQLTDAEIAAVRKSRRGRAASRH